MININKNFGKLIYLFFILILLIGCDNKEVEKLKIENKKLKMGKEAYVKSTNELVKDLQEIYDTLQIIQQQIILYQQGIETKSVRMKDQILQKILLLKEQLELNQKRLIELEDKINKNNKEITNLKSLIASYKRTIDYQNNEIERLNLVIQNLKGTIREKEKEIAVVKEEKKNIELEKETVVKEKELVVKEKEILKEDKYKVFYISGTTNDLLDEGFLYKKGTWPFRNIEFNDKFDKSRFKEKVLTTNFEIIFEGEAKPDFDNITIYPSRPESTYRFEKISKHNFKIVIIKPEEFLGVSKFLVCAID